MCSLLSRENVFVESKWWLVVTFSNKAEEDAFEDVVVLVSDTSDGEESEDGIGAEDIDEEQRELENENAELRRLLFEEKRKTL